MPIKAKPIDPNRARLAARGQWSQLNGTTTPPRTNNTRNVTRTVSNNSHIGSSSSSSSSTSSSDASSTTQERRRVMKNNVVSAKKDEVKESVKPAFLTNTRPIDDYDGSETSNSDPELYRAARERTRRFLYPNERPFKKINVITSSNSASTSKNDKNDGKTGESKITEVMEKNPSVVSTSTNVTAVKPQMYRNSQSKEEKEEVKYIARRANDNNNNNYYYYYSKGKKKDVEVDDCNNTDSDNYSPQTVQPLVVQEALRGTADTTDSVSQSDFSRLLELLAEDVQKEKKGALKEKEGTATSTPVEDSFSAQPKKEDSGIIKSYVRPPRNFAELQDRALLQLYNAQEEKGDRKYFIATDHTSEAFTLASLEVAAAKGEESSGQRYVDPESSLLLGERDEYVQPYGTPLSFMEIVYAERARRNARAALHKRLESGEESLSNCNVDALVSADADVLAVTAEESLNRFMASARCIEAMVHNRHVMDELGGFLFKYHKLFLQAGIGDGNSSDVIREYSHEAFEVYERYSRRVSAFLLQQLKRQVPNFNVEEFVLTLYDVNLQSDETIKRGNNNNNNNNTNNDKGDNDGIVDVYGPTEAMDILSYPARRLLQSMSSFNEFCAFMDDFIAEEYGVEKVVVTDEKSGVGANANTFRTAEDDVIVTAGARGIRALLAKTPPPAQPLTTTTTIETTTSLSLEQGNTLQLSKEGESNNNNNNNNNNNSRVNTLSFSGRGIEAKTDVKQQQQQKEASIFTEGPTDHAESTSALTASSLSAFTLLSRLPLSHTPTAPRASMTSSQCSNQHNSLSSFSGPRRAPRRPEAVPGRNLPPITSTNSNNNNNSGERESMQNTVQARSVQGPAMPTERIAGGSNTAPGTKERRGMAGSSNNNNNNSINNNNNRGPARSTAGRTHSRSAGSGDTRNNRGDARSRSGARKNTEPTSGTVGTKMLRKMMRTP
ncbi:hypothetical protein LSM04_003770 [Trypanosoma melophagium]|uniref:uncharacterized protein n=1 Tax=Trypanosoma melophagium TaxID=715481 RepID=UPI00351A7EFF|nr:hypothetical protein LSM04_003770 [Trypanosoma melophagium]